MGAGLIGLFAVLLFPPPDTLPTFATAETRALVERAMARHSAEDSTVSDYVAKLRYRASFSLGRRQWAQIPAAAVEEQEAVVHWQRPNNLRVDIVGRRSKARQEDFNFTSTFEEPWFVPHGLGDSVRVFGVDFPERAAPHPLSAGGVNLYRYRIVDSIEIATARGDRIRLIGIEFIPRGKPEAALAGRLWVDAASAQVVRLSGRLVGTALWVLPDSSDDTSDKDAARANSIINRVLSMELDLEYALEEQKYWMPYRQAITGTVKIPVVTDIVIPFQVISTFDEYEINTGQPVAFQLLPPDTMAAMTRQQRREYMDSLRKEDRRGMAEPDSMPARWHGGKLPGGRYEIHRVSGDSLNAYADWGDSLELDLSAKDNAQMRETAIELSRLSEELPDEITGRRSFGIGYQKLADIVRYNRVQGWTPGFGVELRPRGIPYTTFYPLINYGISDSRLMGRLAISRDAPSGRWTVAGYRELRDVDPFSPGLTVGNSINAIVTTHDQADYYLGQGGSLAYETSLALGLDIEVKARVEDQSSVVTEATSWFNDVFGGSGEFPPNPPIDDGTFAALSVKLDGLGVHSRWNLTADGLAGDAPATGRLFGWWRYDVGGRQGLTVRVKAGVATNAEVPQMQFRLGGSNTVRGFPYATEMGQALWATQLDWGITGGWIRPVIFADAGQAGAVSGVFRSPVFVGAGAGLSFLRGFFRIDFSYPITPNDGRGLQFNLDFSLPR